MVGSNLIVCMKNVLMFSALSIIFDSHQTYHQFVWLKIHSVTKSWLRKYICFEIFIDLNFWGIENRLGTDEFIDRLTHFYPW